MEVYARLLSVLKAKVSFVERERERESVFVWWGEVEIKREEENEGVGEREMGREDGSKREKE